MKFEASNYGLNSRVKLELIEDNHIGIVKRIKSRIIKKDALKIIELVGAIKAKESNLKVSLICNNNICSKSVKLLNEHGIEISF